MGIQIAIVVLRRLDGMVQLSELEVGVILMAACAVDQALNRDFIVWHI